MNEPKTPSVKIHERVLQMNDVRISFQRTIRVPDNEDIYQEPPILGRFPLYQVKTFARWLPHGMAAKGGLFLPMYQREAMWIKFESSEPYAIKVHSGGINALSGVSLFEDTVTTVRALVANGQPTQDYMILPEQDRLAGVAVGPEQVRQFVAMPVGSGYSVESQLTGQEAVAGLQFELFPVKRAYISLHGSALVSTAKFVEVEVQLDATTLSVFKDMVQRHLRKGVYVDRCTLLSSDTELLRNTELQNLGLEDGSVVSVTERDVECTETIFVKSLQNEVFEVKIAANFADTVRTVKQMLRELTDSDRVNGFLYKRRILNEDDRKLSEYDISSNITIQWLGPGASGAGSARCAPELGETEMGLGPGGLLQQRIIRDKGFHVWDTDKKLTFNVQILQASHFERITGKPPPPTPVTAQTYLDCGFILQETSQQSYPFNATSERLGKLKSISGRDGEPEVRPYIQDFVPIITRGGNESIAKQPNRFSKEAFRIFRTHDQREKLEDGDPAESRWLPSAKGAIFSRRAKHNSEKTSNTGARNKGLKSISADDCGEAPAPAEEVDYDDISFFNEVGPYSTFRSMQQLQLEFLKDRQLHYNNSQRKEAAV